MPFRYIVFEARDCYWHDTTHYIDTVKAYEFYFDAPVVVTDTFLVGFHTFGIDGQQHEWQSNNIDSTGYVYFAEKQGACDYSYPRPVGYFVRDNRIGNPYQSGWGGMLPIIVEPPCNPDTLTCAAVSDLAVTPLDSLRVKLFWTARPDQQDFQISVGLQGTSPGLGRMFSISSSSLVVTGNWDTTATYEAYIRARCEKHCDSSDVEVWSDWAGPVSFFGYQPQDPIGIATPTDEAGLFALMPNPAKDKVTVTLGQAAALPCVVTLRDEQGRELLRQRMDTYPGSRQTFTGCSLPSREGRTLTLSTQGLAAGLYFVTLETPQGTSTQKLVVE